MQAPFISSVPLPEFSPWEKMQQNRAIVSFDLEITARCNNNCRHCYINYSADDATAMSKEISFEQIKLITEQAVNSGALWCLLTGGEPLLREDFFDIYLYLKKRGLLVSVFTNATLLNQKHIEFFKKYPPRDIEVTVYGVTKKTYERVTRKSGSFEAFMTGLRLLLKNKIKVRLKAMAMRSNVQELQEIARFCRDKTKDYFRFDPFLHLRFDRNPKRNQEIMAERLSPEEIVSIEQQDTERLAALEKNCHNLINPELIHRNCNHLFQCGIGNGNLTIGCDGILRLCSSLWYPGCTYDLKKGNFFNAWQNLVLRVRNMRSDKEEFLKKCHRCPLVNLCMWCPALAYLEIDELDKPVDYFCKIAHSRKEMLV